MIIPSMGEYGKLLKDLAERTGPFGLQSRAAEAITALQAEVVRLKTERNKYWSDLVDAESKGLACQSNYEMLTAENARLRGALENIMTISLLMESGRLSSFMMLQTSQVVR